MTISVTITTTARGRPATSLPAVTAHAVTVAAVPTRALPCMTCGDSGVIDDPACHGHDTLDGPPCAVPCPDCNPEGGAT
jgi:hypothetical protein